MGRIHNQCQMLRNVTILPSKRFTVLTTNKRPDKLYTYPGKAIEELYANAN